MVLPRYCCSADVVSHYRLLSAQLPFFPQVASTDIHLRAQSHLVPRLGYISIADLLAQCCPCARRAYTEPRAEGAQISGRGLHGADSGAAALEAEHIFFSYAKSHRLTLAYPPPYLAQVLVLSLNSPSLASSGDGADTANLVPPSREEPTGASSPVSKPQCPAQTTSPAGAVPWTPPRPRSRTCPRLQR